MVSAVADEAPKAILAFGEILWDQLPDTEVLGGAPLNFAYRSATLGDQVAIASRLGTDDLGLRAWNAVQRFGIDTSLIQWDKERATGTVGIQFDPDRTAKIDIKPNVAYDFIEPSPELLTAAEQADCICFGTVAQRNSISRSTLNSVLDRAAKALKVFDVNLRDNCYTWETVCHAMERVDVVKLNTQEAAGLSDKFGLASATIPLLASAMLGRWPLSAVVVTLEEKGSFAASRQGERAYSPGYCVSLTDPLGTGDAFTAGFVRQYLRGKSLAESCRFGNVLGAIVAGQVGATGAIPVEEIQRFLAYSPTKNFDSRLQDWYSEEI